MSKKIVVGQKVIVLAGRPEKQREATVSKVGKKYFYVDNDKLKFDMETLFESSEYGQRCRCFLSLQDILDENEQIELSKELRNLVGQYGTSNISLEKLRKIMEIIKN